MKKVLTFLLLLVEIPAFNQVKLAVNKVDDFTGAVIKVTVQSDVIFFKEGSPYKELMGTNITSGIFFNMQRQDSIIFFQLSTLGFTGGCLSEYAGKALIKLSDGTVIECAQRSSTDCSDNPTGTNFL